MTQRCDFVARMIIEGYVMYDYVESDWRFTMTEAAQELLNAFEQLPSSDQQEVAVEVLRRTSGTDSLSDDALDALADDLFRQYDSEEASRGGS